MFLASPHAATAATPIVGINDPRFARSYPVEPLTRLGVRQVGIVVSPGHEAGSWAIPSNVGVLVAFGGDHWYESHPAAYAAAARRLVLAHPNVRELQVWNEPDLCSPEIGFWSDCLPLGTVRRRFAADPLDRYLDELAATHDALAGTGVKVLGFGFSPPWHHSDRGLSWWDADEIASGIDSWYARRGGRTIVCVGPREGGECISVRIRGGRYPRPIMDGFAYHPYDGWDAETTDWIYDALAAIDMPGATPRLWWTEFGMDTAWVSRCRCRWQGSEAEQAARVREVIGSARASRYVAGIFNFLLTDERDPRRFQTGLVAPDGRRKPAFAAFREAAAIAAS